MKFCGKCENMLYLKLQDNDTKNLMYYCRNCGNEDIIDKEATSIMKTTIKGNNDVYVNVVNKYTKYDNTIPRVKEINCANESCESYNNNSIKDILLIRYDEVNMKYIYLCSVCDYMWKSNIK